MNKKTKIIATSVLSIIMCSSMIAGATYALFTSESTTNIAITSGNVKVNAFAQNISGTSLNSVTEGGTLMTFTGVDENYSGNYEEQDADQVGNVVTFKNGGTAELFDDGNVELTNITPGDKVTFEIVVENYSNVAIQYRTLLTSSIDTTKQTESTTNLFEALEITIEPKTAATVDDGDSTTQATSFYKMSENTTNYSGVENYASKWYSTYKDSKIEKETSTLEVTLFLPLSAGNEYRNLAGNLEFKVEAVQGNAATSGEETFKGVEKQVVEENRSYTIVYGADGTESITITSYTPDENGNVEIPAQINGIDVTEIAENAFANLTEGDDYHPYYYDENKTLKSVVIPETVTEIADNAFNMCVALESVTLKNGLQKIGDDAFSSCKSLKSITFPDSLTEIGEYAFDESGLTSINFPEKLTKIGVGAFSQTSITELNLPATITDIGELAFYACYSLTKVTVSDGIKSLPYSLFSQCKSLETVTLPESLTEIGDLAFSESGLTKIDIPSSVTKINAFTFFYCKNLSEVTLHEGLKAIDYLAFSGCSNLTSITLPSSLESIGIGAFAGAGGETEDKAFSITYNNSVENWEKINVVGDFNVVDNKLAFNQKENISVMNITETTDTADFFAYYFTLSYYEIAGIDTSDFDNEYLSSYMSPYNKEPVGIMSPFYMYIDISGGTYFYTTPVTVTCTDGTVNYKFDDTTKPSTNTLTVNVKSGDTAVETTNVATWVADKSHYDYTEQTGDVKVYYTWNSENETYDTKSYKVTVNDDGQTVETEIVETAESDND